MHRFILFAFLMVCLVCMFEASPTPQEANQEASTQTDLENIKKTLQDTASNIERQAKEMIEKMNLGETMDTVKQFFENTANKMREEAEKLVSSSPSA